MAGEIISLETKGFQMWEGEAWREISGVVELRQLEFLQPFGGERHGLVVVVECAEAEGLNAVMKGVVHALLYEGCGCADETAVEREEEAADGGGR